jgi:hypothetical protein
MQYSKSSRLADLEDHSGIVGASHPGAAIKKSVVALHQSANREVSVAKASASGVAKVAVRPKVGGTAGSLSAYHRPFPLRPR